MADEAIDAEQTVQTAEADQGQEQENGQNEDGGLRPIDHQIINRLKDVEKAVKKPTQQSTQTNQTNQSSSSPDERFERQDLRIDGYSNDEVDFIMRNGGKQALQDKLVIAAIETMRKETKSKEASPSGTGKSYTYQKFGERDLKRMSAEELEKIIPQD